MTFESSGERPGRSACRCSAEGAEVIMAEFPFVKPGRINERSMFRRNTPMREAGQRLQSEATLFR